jgi:very-short-patch-repair endonuclease
MRRHTTADYHELANVRGFRWLGDENNPVNSKTKTLWECDKKHQWSATYGGIYAGHGCPECYEARRADQKPRKRPEDYALLATRRGDFEWLGPEVPNAFTSTQWKCLQCNNIWWARYNNIQQGQGCPKCSDKRTAEKNRYQPDDYVSIGKEKGFEWLGPEVKLAKQKTNWRCLNGHIFEGPLDKIIQDHGCQECYHMRRAELQRYGPVEYNQLASEQKWRWIGPEVRRTDQKTRWACENGHEIEVTYDALKQGRGCSKCSQSRGEKRIQNYLYANGYTYEYQKRFDGCRNKRPLPFDFALDVNGVQVLIEYDGELHFVASRFSTGTQKLTETQRHDAIKDDFAKGNGFTLIRIPYTEFENIEQVLETALPAARSD